MRKVYGGESSATIAPQQRVKPHRPKITHYRVILTQTAIHFSYYNLSKCGFNLSTGNLRRYIKPLPGTQFTVEMLLTGAASRPGNGCSRVKPRPRYGF